MSEESNIKVEEFTAQVKALEWDKAHYAEAMEIIESLHQEGWKPLEPFQVQENGKLTASVWKQ